jgi:hypothetical protein
MVETVPIPATTGRVVSTRNGGPVAGARVAVHGHAETATTSDRSGRFTTAESTGHQFSFLGAGYTAQRYFLTVTREGFSPAQKPWTRPPLLGMHLPPTPAFQVGDIPISPAP